MDWRRAAFGFGTVFGALVVSFLIAKLPAKSQQEICDGSPCNVMLVMVDALSAEHLETYGYARDTLPQTTAFFEKNGTIFDNAYSAAPWTIPSFTALYFSKLPSDVTFRDLSSSTTPNLQNALRDDNRKLILFSPPRSQLIYNTITRPYMTADETYFMGEANGTTTLDKARLVMPHVAQEYRDSGTPFFMVVHTISVHDPYTPLPPYNQYFETISGYSQVTMDDLLELNQELRAGAPVSPAEEAAFELRYDQGIRQLDGKLAALFASIPPDIAKKTVIIVTGDHGEAFGQHGHFWHGESLYDEELHVPLFVAIPGAPRERIETPVSLLDLAPTILTLMHTSVPSAFIGKSLLPLFSGGSLPDRMLPFENGVPYFLEQTPQKPGLLTQVPSTLEEAGAVHSDKPVIDASAFGARVGPWKLFSDQFGTHLFNTELDPGETRDLSTNTSLSSLPVTALYQNVLARAQKAIAP